MASKAIDNPVNPPPTAPSLAAAKSIAGENANNVVSDINAENTITVDHGKGVSEASGSFACKRFGDLQFRFKGTQMFSASTVVFKWRVAGNGDGDSKVVAEKGEQTTKQAVNAAVVKLILGPILGPMMMGPEAKKRDNEIELTVWSEQLYTLKACPGVTLDWNFKVKDGGKVDFNVAHRIDLVKSLRFNEALIKAWGKQQHKIKTQDQVSSEERVRIQKEVQEYETGKNEAKRKTEELKCQLKSQAELAHQKLTKLLKDQEQARRQNADKDELITDFEEKVNTLEIQRRVYLKQVNDLNGCVKSLQTEKTRCVEELWKEREVVAKKDRDLAGQAQTLRSLQSQLEKYREEVANKGEERTKLSDEITALLEEVKQHESTNQEQKLKFAKARVQQQNDITALTAALTEVSDESGKQKSKLDELTKQQQNLTITITEKDKQISNAQDKCQEARASLNKTNAALDEARVELIRSKKALHWEKEEHARTKSESETRITSLERDIQHLEKCTKQNLSDQTLLHKEVERQLQQERARCTKLNNANSSLRAQVTDLRTDLDKAAQDSTRAQSTASQLEKDVQQLRESRQQQKANAVSAGEVAAAKQVATKADADALIAQSKQTLQRLRRQHETQCQSQQATVKELRTTVATLQDQIRNQKNAGGVVVAGDMANARAQVASIFKALKTKSNNTIRHLRETAEEQTATLHAELTHTQSHARSLAMQLERVRGELQDSKMLNNTLEIQKEAMAIEQHAAGDALTLCEKRLLASQDKERLLIEQCREFEFATNRKSRHIASYKTIIAELHQELQMRRGVPPASTASTAAAASATTLAPAATPPRHRVPSHIENRVIGNVDLFSPASASRMHGPVDAFTPPTPALVVSSSSAPPAPTPSAPPLPTAVAVPVVTNSMSTPLVVTARGRAFDNVDLFSPGSSRAFDAGDTFTPETPPSRVYGHEDYFSPGAAPRRFLYSNQLEVLRQMGYGPQERMLALLDKFVGNLNRVVSELLN